MNWKKHFSLRYSHLNPHHHYQMEVALWFIIYFFGFLIFYVYTDKWDLDINTYQWFFFFPLIIIYILNNFRLRNKISPEHRVNPTRRPILHWIMLGISCIMLYTNSIHLEHRPESIILAFIIFSIFFADGYWDFKDKIKFFNKK